MAWLNLISPRTVCREPFRRKAWLGDAQSRGADTRRAASPQSRWCRWQGGRSRLLPGLLQPCDDEIGTAAGYTRVTGGKSGRPIDLSVSDGRVHLLRAALGSHGSPRPERFAWSAVLICNQKPVARAILSTRLPVQGDSSLFHVLGNRVTTRHGTL